MSRSRSPSYPVFSLPEAIARVRKIHDADRRNPVERIVVASHMGYSGISGASDQAISALVQYDLVEKVAKGELKVSQTAIDILHPESETQRKAAVLRAAYSPELFKGLKERFPESRFSDSALRSYLVRIGFVERAVDTVVKSYTETCNYLEQIGAHASEVAQPGAISEFKRDEVEPRLVVTPVAPKAVVDVAPTSTDGERVLTTGLLSKEATFRLLVSGKIGVKEIERLIRKLELDKEILADSEDETDRDDTSVFG